MLHKTLLFIHCTRPCLLVILCRGHSVVLSSVPLRAVGKLCSPDPGVLFVFSMECSYAISCDSISVGYTDPHGQHTPCHPRPEFLFRGVKIFLTPPGAPGIVRDHYTLRRFSREGYIGSLAGVYPLTGSLPGCFTTDSWPSVPQRSPPAPTASALAS